MSAHSDQSSLFSKELKSTLAEELDFELEARNLERCRKELTVFPWLYVPKVDWTLTSKRVLTAEWIDGCKVTDKEAIKKMNLSVADVSIGIAFQSVLHCMPLQVAQKVITAFGFQIFSTGFVHADPHPGNIFIRPLPRGKGAQVVLLDHGLYMPVEERCVCK